MSEYERRISKQVKGKGKDESTAELQLSKDLASLFRIYFPTSDTVGKSRGGKDVGWSKFELKRPPAREVS